MCLIIYRPQAALNKQFPQELHDNALRSNKDGVGVMYPVRYGNNKRKLVTAKLVGTPEEMTAFLKHHWEESAKLKAPLSVHYRFKTHGAVDVTNAHPHRVSDTLYLMHNGIIGDTCKTGCPTDSDTRAFISTELAELVQEYGDAIVSKPAMKKLIERRIGKYNKLVTMDEQGHVNVFNEESGSWEDGLWLSNTHSLPTKVTPYSGTKYNPRNTYNDDDYWPNDGYSSYRGGYADTNGSRFQSSFKERTEKATSSTQNAKTSNITNLPVKELVKDLKEVVSATQLDNTNKFYCYKITFQAKGETEPKQVWFYPNLKVIKDDDGNVLRDWNEPTEQATGGAATKDISKVVADSFRTTTDSRTTSSVHSTTTSDEDLDYISEYVEEVVEQLRTSTAAEVEELVASEMPCVIADVILTILNNSTMTTCTRTLPRSSIEWGS